MKRFFLLFFIITSCSSNSESFILKSVTVKDFKEFINDSDYITDAERYGWSIVQTDVYNYQVVEGANWKRPDGINKSIDSLPVTQVSYNDAIDFFCKNFKKNDILMCATHNEDSVNHAIKIIKQ